MEITHLLKDLNEYIINSMSTQLDTLQEKKKHEEEEAMLVEFCPHCRQKKNNSSYFKLVYADDEQLFYISQ